MSLATMVYLAGVSGGLAVVAFLIAGGIAVTTLFLAMEASVNGGDPPPWRRMLCAVVVFLLMAAAIPSERTIYLMVGASAAQNVAEGEVGQKVLRIVNQKLDEMLTEKAR